MCRFTGRKPHDPNNLKMLLGRQLVNIEEPGDELVKAVIDRISFHEKKNPPLALALRQIIQNWKGAAINALLAERFEGRQIESAGDHQTADSAQGTARKTIERRRRTFAPETRPRSELRRVCSNSPTDFDAILDGDNAEAKTAMLACARLIRAPLPVQKVAGKSEKRGTNFSRSRRNAIWNRKIRPKRARSCSRFIRTKPKFSARESPLFPKMPQRDGYFSAIYARSFYQR